MSSRELDFQMFRQKLNYTYAQFCIWRALNTKGYNITYNFNKYFWNAVLESLKSTFINELAKLLEKPNKKNDEVLSVFYLLQRKFGDYEKLIDKLKKFRNKILAHNDLKTLKDIKLFTENLGFKYNDIEILFGKIIEVMNEVKKDFDPKDITDYKKYFLEIEKNCEKDVKNFMDDLMSVKLKGSVNIHL